jgi:hypothetical protein
MEERCKNCRFWKGIKGVGDGNSGECYRKAPLPYKWRPEENTLHVGTRWPLTNGDQYCGEFEEKS